LNAQFTEKDIIFEHRFWLQILGDHSRFILNELSPEEKEEVRATNYFIKAFDSLLEEARKDISGKELMELNKKAYGLSQEIRGFKLNLLRQHLVGQIIIGLSPTFINHMINELEEYMRILSYAMEGGELLLSAVHTHLLWLLDGSGHACAVACGLDEVEKMLIGRAKMFNKNFKDLYMKAIEMTGYLRTNINSFPALNRFNGEAELEMKMFMGFLSDLLNLRIEKKILGTIHPLMLDHMFREECYYLTKLSQVSEVEKVVCDPTKPRLEEPTFV
jgi:hypothetical protein